MAWDKDKPAGNQKIRLSDEEIRANWAALETQIGSDHDFGAAGSGEHTIINFNAPVEDGGDPGANKGALFIKDVDDKAELHWEDEDGNEIQLTSAGSILLSFNQLEFYEPIETPADAANHGFLYLKDVDDVAELHFLDESGNEIQLTSLGTMLTFPSGTKMYFYQNTAPEGWTIDAACADALLAVKGGAQAFNVDGGNQAGTWTQPGHTLTEAELPSHSHSKDIISFDGAGGCTGWYSVGALAGSCFGSASTDTTGSGDSHNHGTTYRPLAQVGIIATKD